jgi:uncharacterized protein
MKRRLDRAVLMAGVITLTGCSILKPQADPSRFYVLTSTTSRAENVTPPSSGGLTIGVGPIKLPDYLDRSQLVTRLGPNRLAFSDYDRWAEPLERNLPRVLMENLTLLLNTEKIVSLPSFVAIPVQYEVPIEVQSFESDSNGVVELVARWAIRAPADETLLRTGETRITETGGSETEEVVAALSRAVGRLSEQIASDIQRLAQP